LEKNGERGKSGEKRERKKVESELSDVVVHGVRAGLGP
jgi:hypothetical protein